MFNYFNSIVCEASISKSNIESVPKCVRRAISRIGLKEEIAIYIVELTKYSPPNIIHLI
jgi:hypothetical protein